MELVKTIIGLEVHIELKTRSKMFCSCKGDHFGKEPNTQTCPTCLGLPGALPVPNKKAVDWTILLGLSLGCGIPRFARFDRKNYFYPDLPKGYQISQYDKPFCVNGQLSLDSGKIIHIRRAHLEEDTAKLLHETINGEKVSLIDFNRSGVPLMEVVSEPDLSSSDEAKEYLEKLQQLVQYLEISSAEMEKGSMRCEPNVNLEIKDGDKIYFTPIVELKNINSFRFVKKAIDYEIKRQFEEFKKTRIEKTKGNKHSLMHGNKPSLMHGNKHSLMHGNKQTRGWDEDKQITILQRQKEEANDYRYFPDPDIPPIEWSEESIKYYVSSIKGYELPWQKRKRFETQYNLSKYQTKILTQEKEVANYYEQCVKIGRSKGVAGIEIANVIINKRAPENLTPQKLVEFVCASKTTSWKAKEEVDELIKKLVLEHPEVVEGYRKGKMQALGVIVGLVKKEIGIVVPIERIVEIISTQK